MQLSYDPMNLRFLTVGTSISQNVRPFVFESFFSVEPSTLATLLHTESLQATNHNFCQFVLKIWIFITFCLLM